MRTYISLLVLGIALTFIISGCTAQKSSGQTFEQNPSAYLGNSGNCAQDNKICPDGSIVQRVGPNCDFEQCKPAPSDFCDYGSPSRNYKGKDSSQCASAQITCNNGWTKFNDKCGCGCEAPTWAQGGSYCDDSERYYTVCHVNADAPNVCGFTDPATKQCTGKPCTQNFDNRCEACKNKDIILVKPGNC